MLSAKPEVTGEGGWPFGTSRQHWVEVALFLRLL
jgi:hypothetical protein